MIFFNYYFLYYLCNKKKYLKIIIYTELSSNYHQAYTYIIRKNILFYLFYTYKIRFYSTNTEKFIKQYLFDKINITATTKKGDETHLSGEALGTGLSLDPVLANELLAYVRVHTLPKEQVKRLFSSSFYDWYLKTQDAVPLSIFNNDYLSSLEIVVKYLKENLEYSLTKIAKRLNRSVKTIWATYTNAKRKMPAIFQPHESASSFFIPLSLFYDRKYSPLEAVVRYLKEDCKQSYHQIALLLNRDDRTIWSTYHRMKIKLEKSGQKNE